MRIQALTISILLLPAAAPAFAGILYPATDDNLFLFNGINGSPTVQGPVVTNADPFAVMNLQITADGTLSFPSTGTTSVNAGAVTFSGIYAATNIFDISASELAQANGINIDIPAGSDAIINVIGFGDLTLPNVPFNFDPSHTLWNLDLFTSINTSSFSGSIIAPNADVTFCSGLFMGTLIAKSLSGNGEFNSAPLQR